MTERQVNMNYLKGKYISPTWVNMLEECQEWYKEGLKQGKFDEEMGKQQLISFLEDKITETDKARKMHKTYSLSEERLSSKYYAFCEVLDFVNKGGKK